jgi:hypothetical protein
VKSHDLCYLAANVSLHGPRPWHPVLYFVEPGVAFQRENSTGQARGIFDHLMKEEPSGLIDALVKQRYISIKDEDVTYHLPDAL